MTTHSDVSVEFQRRRQATWRRIRWWVLLVSVTGGAFWWGAHVSEPDPTVGQVMFQLVMLAACGTGFVVVVLRLRKNYRCPSCDAIPMAGSFEVGQSGVGYDEGVALNPRTCSGCGAKLR